MADDIDFFTATARIGDIKELDVDAITLLIRIECSGEDFYDQLADRVGNDEAATLLRRNGREETGHARRLHRALAIKLGREPDFTIDEVERFELSLPDTIDAAIFPVIVEAELQGDAGYQGWAGRETDPEIIRLLHLNGREETIHGERVREVQAILEGVTGS